MVLVVELATIQLPSIVYIDESEDARADFFTDAYYSGRFQEVLTLPPESSLTDMVDKILELHVDAVISDFQLTDAGPVDYNGEALVMAILERRVGFPCFIQTSFDDVALRAAEDVNRVYSKNPNAGTGGREQFLQRISLQIERHQSRLAEWRSELDELLSIDRHILTAFQIERILELDEAIEDNIGVDAGLARQAKRDIIKDENLAVRQIELIDETEKLLADMRRALDD
jgi:hypothetical protein